MEVTLDRTAIRAARSLFLLNSGIRPSAVDNSAANFIRAEMGLLKAIDMKAMEETMNIEDVPKRSSAKSIGTPIKSNFKTGKIGKGTFSLRTSIAMTTEARMAVPAIAVELELFMKPNIATTRV